MGTEYYIVKPSTKQVFYLGRRISHLQGLCNWIFSKEARHAEWECFEDVVFDLQENSRYFLEGSSDITIGQVWDFCYQIYEFCDAPVYMDNDCSDNLEWREWEEIDYLSDLLSPEDKWSSLISYVPKEYWITTKKDGINVLHEFESIQNYLQQLADKAV